MVGRALVFALGLVSCGRPMPKPLPEGRTAHATLDECAIDATLTIEPTRFAPQDESVFATFRMTSTCERPLGMREIGSREGRFGRSEAFSVCARTEDNFVGARSPGEVMGGATGVVPISRAEPLVRRLRLSHYLEFPRPDRYEIEVVYATDIDEKTTKMTVSAFVDVVPSP